MRSGCYVPAMTSGKTAGVELARWPEPGFCERGMADQLEVSGRLGFPKRLRIRKRVDFLSCQRGGRRVNTPSWVLVTLARDHAAEGRFGVTASRRVGSAVRRNRVKRVARELFRKHRDLFPAGADVVLIAKPHAVKIGYQAALRELKRHHRALLRGPRNLTP